MAGTDKTYGWHTDKFTQWMTAKKMHAEQVTPKTLSMYFKDTGWSKGTIYVALAALSRYFDTFEDLEDNPASHYTDKNKRKTGFKRLPVALDEQESRVLLSHTALNPSLPYATNRIYMLIRLLYYTGMRQEEGATLPISALHLDDEHPFIQVIGKGNKERVIPIQPDTKDELDVYLQIRQTWLDQHHAQHNVLLFGHRDDTAYSGSGVYRMVEKVLNECGIVKPKMGPHILRHTFATRQLSSGIAPAIVKLWMGHSSMNILFKHYEHVINSPRGVYPA